MTAVPGRDGLAAVAEIAAEIKALRKGRGLLGDVTGKIGPLLLELAGGDYPQVVGRLSAELRRLSRPLPAELRTAVLAALALLDETRELSSYGDRKGWLAYNVLDRASDRTAERRIEEAQLQLARLIVGELSRRRGQADAADEGWYIESFRAVLLLDGATPEAIEWRRIVATRPGLDEIIVRLDTPRESAQRRLGLKAEMLGGGTLEAVDEPSKNRTRFVIRLPRPLRPEETHVYGMRIRVLPGEPMRDYYVCRPERRCDAFELRVRFDRAHPPAWVRLVVAEDVNEYYPYEGVPAQDGRVLVDETGEASASFDRLRPYLGYGLQWSFTDDQG